MSDNKDLAASHAAAILRSIMVDLPSVMRIEISSATPVFGKGRLMVRVHNMNIPDGVSKRLNFPLPEGLEREVECAVHKALTVQLALNGYYRQ